MDNLNLLYFQIHKKYLKKDGTTFFIGNKLSSCFPDIYLFNPNDSLSFGFPVPSAS